MTGKQMVRQRECFRCGAGETCTKCVNGPTGNALAPSLEYWLVNLSGDQLLGLAVFNSQHMSCDYLTIHRGDGILEVDCLQCDEHRLYPPTQLRGGEN